MPQELELTTSIGEGGRIVIPANLRKRIGLNVGDQVVLRVENDELRMFTRKQALRQAQEFVRGLVEPHVSLADELIEERCAEAQNE